MEQLVIGRELPNLKITLAGLETTNSNSNMETDVMEVDEEQDDKTNEEDDVVPDVKIDVKLEFMSYKGMKRYENKAGALTTGLDITSEEFQERLKKRAARFQMECRKMNKITEEEIDALYKSLNINAVAEKSPEKAQGFRLDAIHIRGVNDMSTEDIFAYFGEYGPSSIEWINDVSCNVVWLDASSAARALLGLSRPLILHRRKKTITEENDTEVQSQKTEEEETFIEGGEEVIMMSEDESSDDESMAVDNSQQQDSDISSSVINNNEETVVTSAATGTPTTTVDTCAASSPVTTTTPEGPVSIAVQETITTTTPPPEGPITTTTPESPITSALPEDTITTTPPESPVTTTLSKDSISNVTTSEDPTTTITLEEPVTTTTPEDPVTSTPPEETITSVSAEDPISTTTPDDNELEEKVDEELPLSVPPGYWRLGIPHPKAKVLLLRFATKDDRKIRGAEKRSVYYKKYGNPNYGGMKGLISNSRKRRFWQIQQKRELQELGIKKNEMTDVGLQNNDREVETSSSESENEVDDALKPFRQKLRMKMYADEEESKQKQKRLRLLRYNRKGGQNSSRKRLIQSVMIGNAQPEDSDDGSFDEQDDMVADYLHRSGTSVWKRLTNLDENNSSEFEETSDLRNKLQSRVSSIEERTRSTAPVTGDLRSKLDRIRNKQYVDKHRSPLLIRVANEETD